MTEGATPGAVPPAPAPVLPAADARQQVKGPGLALVISGGIGMGCAVVFALIAMPIFDFDNFDFGAALALLLGLVVVGAQFLVLRAGLDMLQLKSYERAWRAAWIQIIPFVSSAVIGGLPIGIWALLVLLKPEIRAAFQGEPGPKTAALPVSNAAQRVRFAATFMMVSGGISLLQFLIIGIVSIVGLISDDVESPVLSWILVGVSILALLVNSLAIVGGIRMKRLRSYRFVQGVVWTQLIPGLSTGGVVGIFIGLWALFILREPEIRAAFQGEQPSSEPSAQSLANAAEQVRSAATFLMWGGIVGLPLFLFLGTLGGGYFFMDEDPEDAPIAWIILGVGILGLLVNSLAIVGGIKMRRLRSYGFVQVAAWTQLIPGLSMGGVVGIFAGIWALRVLWRPGIKASFGSRSSEAKSEDSSTVSSGVKSDVSMQDVERHVRVVGMALLLSSSLNILVGVVQMVLAIAFLFNAGEERAKWIALLVFIRQLAFAFLFILLNAAILIGAFEMRVLRSYWMARIAAVSQLVLALLTGGGAILMNWIGVLCGMGVLNLLLGLWAFLVLGSEVKAVFRGDGVCQEKVEGSEGTVVG